MAPRFKLLKTMRRKSMGMTKVSPQLILAIPKTLTPRVQ